VIARPKSSEYAPYYDDYVALVPAGDVVVLLERGADAMAGLLREIGEEGALFRYATGKWSIKEVAGHVCDTERVYAYRALRFARLDPTVLPGFEQGDFVAHGGFDARPLESIIAELRAVRAASVALFKGMAPEMFDRKGRASGFEFTVRSIPYILAGHELHHMNVIKTRYLRRDREQGNRP
jgi:hypothetical protein